MSLIAGTVALCPVAIRKDLERLFRESSGGTSGKVIRIIWFDKFPSNGLISGQTREMGQAYHRFHKSWTSLDCGLFQILSVDQTSSSRKHVLQFLYQETLTFLSQRDSHGTVLFTLYALYNTQPKRYFTSVPVIVTPGGIVII